MAGRKRGTVGDQDASIPKRRTIDAAIAGTVGRPRPRTVLERAQRIADDIEGMWEVHEWQTALAGRFRGAGHSEVIRMWKSDTNEAGKPLTKFEAAALAERWCELFGFMPPGDDTGGQSGTEPQLEDDTRLPIEEVVRITGRSVASIERDIREEPPTFPLPVQAKRGGRRYWLARDIKAWATEHAWRR
jgi:predicted DNA-binding transcriptional regulator AlpA